MSKHTLEQVLEHLINKEDDRASELLHQFFVAKGKSIYEELSQFDEEVEEDLDEAIGGSAAEGFEEEITDQQADLDDERLFSEDEENGEEDPMAAPMGDEPTEPEATADLAMGGEEGEGEAEEKVEDAMTQVEDALAELKALFAEITGEPAGEEGGEEAPEMGGEEPTEESIAALGENVALQNVAAPANTDGAANKKSPVASSKRVDGNGAAAVKINDGSTNGGEAGAGGGQLKGNGLMKGNVVANPDAKNVGTAPGNKKAPSLQSVSVPKMNDSASNKTSPVAKS